MLNKKKLSFQLKCPKCGLPAEALLDGYNKFIIYTCPKCHSNVVYYKNKIETISDGLLRKLVRNNRVKSCGRMAFEGRKRTVCVRSDVEPQLSPDRTKPISYDDVLNLKILLGTVQDSAKVIQNL